MSHKPKITPPQPPPKVPSIPKPPPKLPRREWGERPPKK